MKYFMVEGIMRGSSKSDSLKERIAAHLAYIQKGFEAGFILFSGPKALGGGGIIVMKGETEEEVERYLAGDPMKQEGIQDYRIIEFCLFRAQDGLMSWFTSPASTD